MRIERIIIRNWRQFENLDIPLRRDLGFTLGSEPLKRICFIGTNGTGKSTLLRLVFETLDLVGHYQGTSIVGYQSLFALKVSLPGVETPSSKSRELGSFYICRSLAGNTEENGVFLLEGDVEMREEWTSFVSGHTDTLDTDIQESYALSKQREREVRDALVFHNEHGDLMIYAPAESPSLIGADLPEASLGTAQKLFENFPATHTVSIEEVSDFWNVLMYWIRKREADQNAYLERSENQDKPVAVVREEFAKLNPDILSHLAKLWGKILVGAGLELDLNGVKRPVQLSDNLRLYVRHCGSGDQVPYRDLSTGIRHFIFRLGHISALFFRRNPHKSLVLIDEPENSLHPDFLYDLLDHYEEVTPGAQRFFATHSPVFSAQFKPEERIILGFDENGKVVAHQGESPEGDDPNDLLRRDFNVRSILGPKFAKD